MIYKIQPATPEQIELLRGEAVNLDDRRVAGRDD